MQITLRNFIQHKIETGVYAGAVALVSTQGQVEAEVCLGKLGADLDSPMTLDALFSLESISKVVCTAPLVLLLSESGIMGLDEPLAKWIKEFRGTDKASITPRQVLSHSAGLPDIDDLPLDPTQSTDILWKQIVNCELMYSPGTRVRYSDVAYLILGRAVETATGKSLDALAVERLWSPLGMKDTFFNPPPAELFRCTANQKVHGKCVDPIDRALGGVVGCDGVFSNAQDLRKFAQMILQASLLSRASVQEFVKDQTPFASHDSSISGDFDYLYSARKALGWELPGTAYCHGGTKVSKMAFGKVGGTGTFLWIDPQAERIAIYLTNYGQPVPFSAAAWSKLISDVGSKEFFEITTR